MLPHISDQISSVSAERWGKYHRRIMTFANSETIREASYETRLEKIAEIAYMPEELGAIAAKE